MFPRNPSGLLSVTLLLFIQTVYFHFKFTVMKLDIGRNKGVTTVSLHIEHLKGNDFNQNILPYALEKLQVPAQITIRQFEFIFCTPLRNQRTAWRHDIFSIYVLHYHVIALKKYFQQDRCI